MANKFGKTYEYTNDGKVNEVDVPYIDIVDAKDVNERHYKTKANSINDTKAERLRAEAESARLHGEISDVKYTNTSHKSNPNTTSTSTGTPADFAAQAKSGKLFDGLSDEAKKEAFKDLGIGQKAKAGFNGNFGKNVGNGMKFANAAGYAVSIGAIIDGTKKIIAPKRNEAGEREGSAWVAAGEAGAGVLGLIALTRRGAGLAMGGFTR